MREDERDRNDFQGENKERKRKNAARVESTYSHQDELESEGKVGNQLFVDMQKSD